MLLPKRLQNNASEAWLKNKKSAIDAEKAKVSAAKDAAAKNV